MILVIVRKLHLSVSVNFFMGTLGLSGLGLRNENSQINAYTAIQYYCVSNLGIRWN